MRLLCLLSGTHAAAKVRHYRVPAGGKLDDKKEMPLAEFLVIEATAERSNTGALLYRFDSKGECVGDTWHRTIEEAKNSAAAEYKGLVQNWQEIPDGVDINAFAVGTRN